MPFSLLSHSKGLVFCCCEEAGQDLVCTSFSSAVMNSFSEQGKQGSAQLGARMYQEAGTSPPSKQLLSFLIYSSDCIFPFFFREEEGKKEIESLEKQLQDVKKETEIELQVRSLGITPGGSLLASSPLLPRNSSAVCSTEPTCGYITIQQNNCSKDLYSE